MYPSAKCKRIIIYIITIIMKIEEESESSQTLLPLLSFNHISLMVKSVETTVKFYENVLGFVLVKRPASFDFNGAWLYNYGIGIHLLEITDDSNNAINERRRPLNPKDNHISFQCGNMKTVKKKVEEIGMKHVHTVVEDEGIKVEQVFFHDPDGYMIEICNCENLPVVPISSCPLDPKPESTRQEPALNKCCAIEKSMMERLTIDLMSFSF